MKIAVTGCLGHIGSALIRELPSYIDNCYIVGIDSLSSQRFSSLFGLSKDRFSFIEGDVAELNLDKIFAGLDYVIHLAAITDAAGSFDIAEQVEQNNLESTKAVARSANKHGVKLVSISSTSVYGTQQKIVTEDCADDELRPQSPYAETKLKEENVLRNYGALGDTMICLRFGTIYGTSVGMRFHTAVNKFCWQATMGAPLSIWKTAYKQKRPYLYLGDAVAALAHVIANQDLKGFNIFNVLTGNHTVEDVVYELKKYYPNLGLNFVDDRIMNQLSYEVSNEKFAATGFATSGNLHDGIFETLSLLNSEFAKPF